ncbi:unnamed protein product [Strongylus vulgaris]|uniref:Choline/ethanolamine kinase n=1 Tax=Strongylus vulgaris TaxID=40348 RepID=A0A3P7LBT0_STRVU|nr:unnamed protein product [Strongylus vulgaris]
MPTEIMNFFKTHNEVELRNRILSLCADVLGGKWSEVHPNNICVAPIPGGLTNLVYLVSRTKFSSLDEQPDTVLLRIQSQTDYEKLLNELVVFTTLAEKGLGPKLLGVFPGGRFEEYIPSRNLEHHEVTDPRTCFLLARLLPEFHSVNVPVYKRPSILNLMREWLTLFKEQGNSCIQMKTTSFQLYPNTFPSTISTSDLFREIDSVEEFLSTTISPVVFCHNDLTLNIHIGSEYSLLREIKQFQPIVHLFWAIFNLYCEKDTLAIMDCGAYARDRLALYYQSRNLNIHIGSEYSLLREIKQFQPIVHLFWAIFNLYCEKDTLAIMDCGAYARDRLALYYQSRNVLCDR